MDHKTTSYILKAYNHGKMIARHDTSKYQRFLHQAKGIMERKWTSVYIRVNYGIHKDAYGRSSLFHNDMTCKTKEDFKWAIKCFATEYL